MMPNLIYGCFVAIICLAVCANKSPTRDIFRPFIGFKDIRVVHKEPRRLEASTNQGLDQQMPVFDLPSKILCKAEADTDEVFAQITLMSDANQSEVLSPDPAQPEPERCTVHSFCKTLAASDTSTHGAFSVLRRHADECLPPLV